MNAVSSDDSTATVELGKLYEGSEFVKRDLSNSSVFFLKGARQGNLAALSGFARMYWGKEREKLMEFAIEKGDRHPYTTQLLGLYYMQGLIIDADYLKSAYYYGIAAGEGSVEGAWQMAGFFYRGYMMERDLDKAAYWVGVVQRSDDGARADFYREQAGLLLERIEKAKYGVLDKYKQGYFDGGI
jgi:TPR repeat protein